MRGGVFVHCLNEVIMFKHILVAGAIALACGYPMLAAANDSDEMEKLRAEVQQMKQSYEARIQSLESKLEQVQSSAVKAEASAAKAETAAVQASSQTTTASASAFNPGIALILSGIYSNLSQNPNDYTITGFQSGGNRLNTASPPLAIDVVMVRT
jgi:cell division protein ZapA (FtsZ GTPase activity inhibitor)